MGETDQKTSIPVRTVGDPGPFAVRAPARARSRSLPCFGPEAAGAGRGGDAGAGVGSAGPRPFHRPRLPRDRHWARRHFLRGGDTPRVKCLFCRLWDPSVPEGVRGRGPFVRAQSGPRATGAPWRLSSALAPARGSGPARTSTTTVTEKAEGARKGGGRRALPEFARAPTHAPGAAGA